MGMRRQVQSKLIKKYVFKFVRHLGQCTEYPGCAAVSFFFKCYIFLLQLWTAFGDSKEIPFCDFPCLSNLRCIFFSRDLKLSYEFSLYQPRLIQGSYFLLVQAISKHKEAHVVVKCSLN